MFAIHLMLKSRLCLHRIIWTVLRRYHHADRPHVLREDKRLEYRPAIRDSENVKYLPGKEALGWVCRGQTWRGQEWQWKSGRRACLAFVGEWTPCCLWYGSPLSPYRSHWLCPSGCSSSPLLTQSLFTGVKGQWRRRVKKYKIKTTHNWIHHHKIRAYYIGLEWGHKRVGMFSWKTKPMTNVHLGNQNKNSMFTVLNVTPPPYQSWHQIKVHLPSCCWSRAVPPL